MKQENIDIKKLAINMGQVPGLPKNPRLIKDKRYQALIKSLIEDPEMLDLREIIAYDHQGSLVVICGNMRVRAAREIGMKTLPVKILPPETPIEKLKAYLIKDNVSFGSDDWGLLMTDWDRGDLETWGLDTSDRWTKKTEAEEDDHDIDADLKTDIKIGDLFQIGPHRLLCGDSTRADDFARLMGEEKADLIFTDPPYGLPRKWDDPSRDTTPATRRRGTAAPTAPRDARPPRPDPAGRRRTPRRPASPRSPPRWPTPTAAATQASPPREPTTSPPPLRRARCPRADAACMQEPAETSPVAGRSAVARAPVGGCANTSDSSRLPLSR
jgi:hypothetical protein